MEEKKGTGFGQLIRKKRKSNNWSLVTLADETDKVGHRLSESYLNRLENGIRKEPSVAVVLTLIQALRLSLEEVLESFDMGHIFQNEMDNYSPVVIPDNWNNLNIQVKTEEEKFSMSGAQKDLIGQVIIDLYEIALLGEPSYFENRAEGYVLKLIELLVNEQYLIELVDQEFRLFFDVRVMVDRYNLLIDDIKSSLENINIKSLYNTDISIPLPILNEYWLTKKDKNIIIVIDKVSEALKPYIKTY
ncbi:helix-turn-helix domain-containing protein [Bacillus andreraoultii]|uniref:helix-turn-helix domain-containing protein n=1 Tax=Bacillus andreraoultii TaxID=1499685 RepID=UPI00053AF9D9|nr:helix-turn-helix transcriptional regulator [Bacillus andreraoultii]